MFVHFNYSLFLFSCNNRIFWLINNTNSLFRFLFPLKFLNGMKTSKFFDFKSGENHRIIFHLSPWLTAPSFCGTIQPTVVRQWDRAKWGAEENDKDVFSPASSSSSGLTEARLGRCLGPVKETSLPLITASHTKAKESHSSWGQCWMSKCKLEAWRAPLPAVSEGFSFRHGKF